MLAYWEDILILGGHWEDSWGIFGGYWDIGMLGYWAIGLFLAIGLHGYLDIGRILGGKLG